ncbi:uncharacterized protein E0L32_002525 [Thyridium curvatum]|uniref:Uncharacterized protein n=1 Tax=Thyridium curvatum TaxID=1093900 RepID=A0A507BPE2_9PEZI|nr:uncharacterized protein E0L32_002525 [Thyridium curvatum]TPX18668.1 hypothetical protein E0L32_002525 [Thyridium curvatum]
MAVLDDFPDIAIQIPQDEHFNLERRYRTHRSTVAEKWRSFTKNQRAHLCRRLFSKYNLREPVDAKLVIHASQLMSADAENVPTFSALAPELHPLRICADVDYLLNLLEERATKSLFELYKATDYSKVMEVLVLPEGISTVNCPGMIYTTFTEGTPYVVQEEWKGDGDQPISDEPLGDGPPSCVPGIVGMFVLERQAHLAEELGLLIALILKEDNPVWPSLDTDIEQLGSQSKTKFHDVARDRDSAVVGIAELPAIIDAFAVMLKCASSQVVANPATLFEAIRAFRLSSAGRVPDKHGESMLLISDKHNSVALVELFQSDMTKITVWNYLTCVLERYASHLDDPAYCEILLQEISNICALVFECYQANFQRMFQTLTGAGLFRRLTTKTTKSGEPCIVTETEPDKLPEPLQFKHHLLRMCSPGITITKALQYHDKTSDWSLKPDSDLDWTTYEMDSYFSMISAVIMLDGISEAIPQLPNPSTRKGRHFSRRLEQLDKEMNLLKTEIDLVDFLSPLECITEPGVAVAATDALDSFMLEKAGAKFSHLYQDLIEESLADLDRRCREAKAQQEKEQDQSLWLSAFQGGDEEARQELVEQRRLKEKTRPAHSSIYDLARTPEDAPPIADDAASAEVPHFTVTASTKEVFATLLDKSSAAKGSITWADFIASMAELRFSIIPKMGSVYAFLPPKAMNAQRSLTIHRPHQSKIEGTLLSYYASRLRHVFGWDENTFETS